MVTSGEGVQVLFVEEDGRYRCDEGALRRVAAGGAARGLPVAVVSVAGATRGGKSFLLDFFLRYLRAPEEARRSGSWLGADDEPLTGFKWRGGCERHTEGILIWSEPIVVDVGSNGKHEKVAVVLLDTQGAFDSSSTMRDSSTVFALSTLLSSVQVYNLSQNIKEDDLHYLQLFTEYGKLAREEDDEKPFQELRFLVRDWCFAYDHPVGAAGGQQLLDKRLEIRAEQASELREIRAHVRGAFERVRGFLLPHPGLTVATSPVFTGCIKDISVEFKNALLELVPSLFAPEHLTIKHIRGQQLTLQDFVEYFKTYVEIFNSDTLPTPTTVMQATSTASLEAALSACRQAYGAHLERCAGGAACVPRGAVARHHAAALAAARQAFAARRTLAAPALAAARLDALMQELDASLSDYEIMNSGRILETAACCKSAYEVTMETDKCLSPDELTAKHDSAVDFAKRAFYSEFAARTEEHRREHDDNDEHESNSGEHEDDNEEHNEDDEFEDDNDDWKNLEKELEELLPLHRERNAARIAAAQESGREVYTARMLAALESAPCLHPHSLRALDIAAADAASQHLLRAWHDADSCSAQLRLELTSYMKDKYREFFATNEANNIEKVKEAITIYKNIMFEVCNGEGALCLHPRELKAQHERAEAAAAARFSELRDAASGNRTIDSHQQSVHRGVIPHYLKFEKDNETRNKAAVQAAHELYMRNIAPARVGGGAAEGVMDVFGPPDTEVFRRHPLVMNSAIQHFHSKRRSYGNNYVQDTHLDDLKKKIGTSLNWIKVKFTANIATTGAGIFAMGAMMFMGRR